MTDLKGHRKLILTLLLSVAAIALDKLSLSGLSDNLKQLLGVLAVSFASGNAIEHMSGKPGVNELSKSLDALHNGVSEIAERLQGASDAPPVVSEVTDELKVKLQALTNSSALSNQANSAILTKLDSIVKAAGLKI